MNRETKAANVRGIDDSRLHRRQLYHWMGGGIDRSKVSEQEKAKQYCKFLKDALQKGLRLKVPRKEDSYGKEGEFKVRLPICCFTETSVTEIANHTREYGSMGLGFPKRVVLKHHGMPVHYGNDKKNNPHFQAFMKLKQFVDDPAVRQALTDSKVEKKLATLENEFEYLTHYLKRMASSSDESRGKKKLAKKSSAKKSVKKKVTSRAKPIYRSFGETLPYLEEREWRIVLKSLAGKTIPRACKDESESNLWHLKFNPNKELFTVVFPNYRTMLTALEDADIREQLLPVKGQETPPVTLLTLDQIKTF
ncbi:abortive infection system antitoxin AbiGi family protein [Mariniblastus sp.]|nr:abortive infection system antitoxin AbiGi family protein [Mariniblastus sp.]